MAGRFASFHVGKRIAGVAAQRSYLEVRIPAGVYVDDLMLGVQCEGGPPGQSNLEIRTTRFDAAAPAFTNVDSHGITTGIQYVASNVALPAVGETSRLWSGTTGGANAENQMGPLYPLGSLYAAGADHFIVVYQQLDNTILFAFLSGRVSSWR